jgi:hypothetical protein
LISSPSATFRDTHSAFALCPHDRRAARRIPQFSEGGDMVGVDVRVDGEDEVQIELGHEL